MLAIEFSIPPPDFCLATSSSRSTSEYSGAQSTPMGMSKLLLTAEASSSPTRRGIDCSRCCKFVCATASSSRSSESSSYAIKIAGTSSHQLATSSITQEETRNTEGKKTPKTKHKNKIMETVVVHTCFPALHGGPQRRCYNLDVLLEANRLIRLASPMRVLQGRCLRLVLIAFDGKQDVFR